MESEGVLRHLTAPTLPVCAVFMLKGASSHGEEWTRHTESTGGTEAFMPYLGAALCGEVQRRPVRKVE